MECSVRPDRLRRLLSAAAGALVAILASLPIQPVLAEPPCAGRCKDDVVACRRTECAGLTGAARGACLTRCRAIHGCAAIRTIAYVVTGCRQDADGLFGRQALVVRQGNCEPAVVAEIETPLPVDDPFLPLGGICALFGRFRAGYRSVWAGPFQRIGVNPDGSVVVFEVTSDFSLLPNAFPLSLVEGIYVVGADGRGLRHLAAPSRNQSGRIAASPDRILGGSTYDVTYRFSPDGRSIVFTDRGPGPGGEEEDPQPVQIVTLDLKTGERRQVTRLSAANDPEPGEPVTSGPRFADADTIVFFTHADLDGRNPDGGYYSVRTDGTGLAAVSTVALPGAHVQPTFDIGGGGTNLLAMRLLGTPVNFPQGRSFLEMFIIDGERVLQVTDFRRTDTGFGGKVLDRRARRGYFTASADPFGTNPSENCQLFSVGTLGTGLRQITRFREAEHSIEGCNHGDLAGCGIGPVFQDPVTKTLVFYSSCDALGTGFYGGQVYAVLPDGTGLRQLTTTRGLVTEPTGAVSVELPGPVAYSARDGGR